VLGCETNTAFLRRLTDDPDFADGALHTGFLDEHPALAADPPISAELAAKLIAAAALSLRPVRDAADAVPELFSAMGAWRN
jgi:acetyl/propionyl-CoA carboxylase alpha subunit